MRPLMRAAPPDLESLSAQEVLAHVVDEYHPRLYVACSFQKEASVILDMLLAIEPEARVFTLDTGVLFPETYETWRRIRTGRLLDLTAHRGLAPRVRLQQRGVEQGTLHRLLPRRFRSLNLPPQRRRNQLAPHPLPPRQKRRRQMQKPPQLVLERFNPGLQVHNPIQVTSREGFQGFHEK